VFVSATACCSITEDTSPSHARSGVFFDPVSRFDTSASDSRRSPHACRRTAIVSLYATRAHPNARASA